MKELYRTKYPSKQIFISMFIVFGILLYIFWGVFNLAIILLIGIISLYLISITMIPIFILKEDSFKRFYPLKLFNSTYTYPLTNIQKIEVRQKRQGYQSFPTMKIFFKKDDESRKHLFYFIKDSQKDFDFLLDEALKRKINIVLLSGN